MLSTPSFYPSTGTTRPSASVKRLLLSISVKNPKRPYFACREYEEACKFFQWGDEELTDANFQLAMEQEEKRQMQKASTSSETRL